MRGSGGTLLTIPTNSRAGRRLCGITSFVAGDSFAKVARKTRGKRILIDSSQVNLPAFLKLAHVLSESPPDSVDIVSQSRAELLCMKSSIEVLFLFSIA